MKEISKHITYQEATKSQVAIRKGIDNTPNEIQLANMKLVAERCFEPIREWYDKPLVISSFFRCEALNKAIKGSKTSQHRTGQAIDIDTGNNKENAKIFNWCKDNLEFDELIWEFGDASGPSWVHISYNQGKNQKEIIKIK